MSGTFFGFNTALRGLFAQQKAMNTTSHNIANANTSGYTRQQVVMEATVPFPVPSLNRPGGAGQLGTGVDVSEIRRVRDKFLDYQIRNELESLGQWEQKRDVLKEIETVFMEPSDSGLSSLFEQFWSVWQDLSKYAENSYIRTTVKETAIVLADAFRHTYQQLETINGDLEQVADIKAKQVNTLARQIDDLNKQIANIQLSGDSPNDLKDQRDVLLDELSKLVNFTIEEHTVDRPGQGGSTVQVPDGQIIIYLVPENADAATKANNILVNVDQANNVRELTYDAPNNTFNWADNNIPIPVNNGELFGLMDARELVGEYLADIDGLAADLISQLNLLHENGYDLDGQLGGLFFTGSGAGDIGVAIADVSEIAASAVPNNKGNGEIALQIAQLKNKTVTGGTSLNNTTIDRFYNGLISRIGVVTNEADRMATNQQALVTQLENRKESVSGVSVDEEMTNLLQYQRAYQAAAKVITTLDEMIQTILSIKR